MIDVFIWFITVELLSLIALPATFVLFKSLPDRGYAFGKALSILIEFGWGNPVGRIHEACIQQKHTSEPDILFLCQAFLLYR